MKQKKQFILMFLGFIAFHNLILCSSLGLDSLPIAFPSILLFTIVLVMWGQGIMLKSQFNVAIIIFMGFIFILKPLINPSFPNEIERLNSTNIALNYAQLEVAGFVRENGSCPASLGDIKGLRTSMAIDPFNQGRNFFKVAVRGNVCIIYSVGPDRKDDHATSYLTYPDISIERISSALVPSSLHLALCMKVGLCHAPKGDLVREVIRVP